MQDDAAPTTPPAFPEWLKRMFPTLRAEETNMLFQAFRERRLRRRSGWIRNWIPNVSGWSWFTIIVACAVFTYYSIRSSPNAIFYVIYVLGMSSMLRHPWDLVCAHLFGKNRPSMLPYSLHEVFGTQASADAFVLDLWIVGVSARDVIEAMYLEFYSEWWRPVSLGVAAVVGLIGVYVLGDHAELSTLWRSISVTGLALTGVYGWVFALLLLHHRVTGSIIRGGWQRWCRPYFRPDARTEAALTKAMTLDLKERMKTWPFMVMIMSSASILISMVSFYFILLHPSRTWREVLGIDLTLTQLSCPVLFATAAIFGALSVRGRAKLSSELSAEIERGTGAYTSLMEGIAEHASSSPAGPHT